MAASSTPGDFENLYQYLAALAEDSGFNFFSAQSFTGVKHGRQSFDSMKVRCARVSGSLGRNVPIVNGRGKSVVRWVRFCKVFVPDNRESGGLW